MHSNISEILTKFYGLKNMYYINFTHYSNRVETGYTDISTGLMLGGAMEQFLLHKLRKAVWL